jgi:hypothetical protein
VPILTKPAALSTGYEMDENRPGGAEWRERSKILYRYLVRDMQDARDQRAALYPKTHSSHVLRPVPLVYRLAVELASLYRRPPARRWVDPTTGEPLDEEISRRISRLYEGARVDRAMLHAQRMAVATGNAPIMVWPMQANEVRGVRLLVLPPHLCEVHLTDALSDDEKDVAAMWARMPTDRDGATGRVLYAIATMTPETGTWDASQGDGDPAGLWHEAGINPIGKIPLVMVRRSTPGVGEFWASVPEDVLASQRAAIHDLTDIGQFARMQGYSQPVMKGGAPQAQMELGPETAVHVPDDGDFKYASPSPDLDGNQRQIERYLEIVVALNGGTPDSVMRSKGITALAKMVERADREQERQDWIEEFKRAEQRTYGLIRRWVNWQRGAEVLPPARVEIEYRDAWLPADPLHQAQARDLAYAHGTSSPVRDVAREQGLTHEEATAYVEGNRAEVTAANVGRHAPPANVDEQGGGTQLGGG